MASFSERMIGAAMLNVNTYEEVEADTTATTQAMVVVILSSLAAGIGVLGSVGVVGMIGMTLAALFGWFIWAAVIFLVGTKILPEPQTQSDIGELLRTIGFASGPGILRIFAFIPLLGWLISFAASIWVLVATVIAVRQALDYQSTGRAVGVCAIGFLIYLAVMLVVGSVVGVAGLAGSALTS